MESETSEEVDFEQDQQEYFFDTYAVFEILKQNPSYAPYTNLPATITIFNSGEIYFAALHDLGEERANQIYSKYKDSVVEIDDETLKESVKFRRTMNKRQLSYADCIGYIYAKRHGMKFLTGDPQFENLEGAEFVK